MNYYYAVQRRGDSFADILEAAEEPVVRFVRTRELANSIAFQMTLREPVRPADKEAE